MSTNPVLYGQMVIGNLLTSTGMRLISFHGCITTVQSKKKSSSTTVGVAEFFVTTEISTLVLIVTIQVFSDSLIECGGGRCRWFDYSEIRYVAAAQMGELFHDWQEILGIPTQCGSFGLYFNSRAIEGNGGDGELRWKHVTEHRPHSLRRDISDLWRASERYRQLAKNQWWSHLLDNTLDLSKWHYYT